MARLEDTEKRHNTHMVRTIRVCLYRTRMVRKIVPYAYGMYHTRMVHTIRVRYKIRIWYRTYRSIVPPDPRYIGHSTAPLTLRSRHFGAVTRIRSLTLLCNQKFRRRGTVAFIYGTP